MSPTRSDLDQFPRPSVAVDVAVLTALSEGGLGLLIHRRTGDQVGQWALPGRFLRERERLATAATTALAEKCGLSRKDLAGREVRQLHVFDDPERDDRGWVISVAHLLTLPLDAAQRAVARRDDLALAPIVEDRVHLPGKQRRLPYHQDDIVARAVETLRAQYEDKPDPAGLLPEEMFTLSTLQYLHSAVGTEPSQVDTFRRRMLPYLAETGELTTGTPGRPATIYRRRKEPS